jgi:hypothetical protein
LIGNASGHKVEGKRLLRGIFDKETRRKALAVVDAAMELRGRLGVGNTAKSVALTCGREC